MDEKSEELFACMEECAYLFYEQMEYVLNSNKGKEFEKKMLKLCLEAALVAISDVRLFHECYLESTHQQ